MRRLLTRGGLPVLLVVLAASPASAGAGRPDRARWPANERMVLIQNDRDQVRPLDGRTGRHPFAGRASWKECNRRCEGYLVPCRGGRCVPGQRMWDARRRYLKLLGGHGSDRIHGGPFSDVIWGDFKPSGQPSSQVDRLDGGAGRDYIYTSHGRNTVTGGRGDDYIVARFSRGTIECGPGDDIVFVSKASRRATSFTGCETITRGSLR